MKPRVMLTVDLSYQIYRAAASHPMLTSGDTFTGGLYGFLQSFGKTVRETGATDVMICRDSKPYLRSLVYPEYKQIRKKTSDPELKRLYDESEPLVLELLALMGVPVWAIPGFESDDLSALVVTGHRSRYVRIYAASNDSDLYQLFNAPSFAVFKDSLKTCASAATLKATLGLTPDQFMLASSLMGTHNDIEGIKGVGEKTAAKIVKDPGLLRQYQANHKEMIERNLALIKLPHPDLPRDSRMPVRTRSGSSRDLYRWCSRYDIDVTLPMVNAFDQIDNLRGSR